MSKKQNYKDDPTTPKVLKVRCGDPKGGGKGALANENQAFTLAVTNDQVLFQPVCYGVCAMDSNAMKSPNPHSGFYEAKTSRTLDTNGGNPCCSQGGVVICDPNSIPKRFIMTEYHPNDSRMKIDNSGTCQTLTSRMGTGGNNVPCVMEVIDG